MRNMQGVKKFCCLLHVGEDIKPVCMQWQEMLFSVLHVWSFLKRSPIIIHQQSFITRWTLCLGAGRVSFDEGRTWFSSMANRSLGYHKVKKGPNLQIIISSVDLKVKSCQGKPNFALTAKMSLETLSSFFALHYGIPA